MVYVTNGWGPHHAPICKELVRLLGENDFKLCLFDDRWSGQFYFQNDGNVPNYKWIEGPPRTPSDMDRMRKIICEADVAIIGSCPRRILNARIATGRLTFIMDERILKIPLHGWRVFNLRYIRGLMIYRWIANHANVHYLSIGAYAAQDVRRIGAYGDRIWNWAYFPEVASQPPQFRTNDQMQVLWVGRMLDWKRVDLLLKAIARVSHAPAFGRLNVVGAGPEKIRLMELAQQLGLDGKCIFHDPVSSAKVRELMRQSDVYVLPSNRHEGWGAVANEAMSEGAVLVANEQAGAARMLVDHNRTGFLFKDDDVDDLTTILRTLLDDATLRETIRQAAWQEMQKIWHPRVGAERLMDLSQGLLGLDPMPEYQDGPCCHVAKGRI
jgi:glycosyltransferase involved in cell wall biosynthesis